MVKIFILSLIIQFSYASTELKVGFGDSLPPWVMPETNEGLILDILKKCLEPEGYKIVPVYHPYARRITNYQRGNIDVVTDINLRMLKKGDLKGSFSGYVYAYENFAFALSNKKFDFKEISELEKYSLLSWQGAINHLSDEYSKMAKNNKKYKETSQQKSQVQMLFLNRYDVVQLDYRIFQYYKSLIEKKGFIDTDQKIDMFPLFGKSPNGYLFRDKKIQKLFIKNLKKLRKNKKYKSLLYSQQGSTL